MDTLEVDGERRPVAFPQRGKTVDCRAHAPAFAALDEFGLIVVDAQTVAVEPRRRRLDLKWTSSEAPRSSMNETTPMMALGPGSPTVSVSGRRPTATVLPT